MSARPKVLGVIPARYDSARFPGKPLAPILGKPMIQHVYERAVRARYVDWAAVATDDERIARAVDMFGDAVMTGECATGADRVAEVSARYPEYEIVLNIQGDEPLLEPAMLDALAEPFFRDETVVMTTLAEKLTDRADFMSKNVVKVVTDKEGFALYFSRASIPGCRADDHSDPEQLSLRHVGLYGFRRGFLHTLTSLEPTPLERREGLEQLRALENGYRIYVSVTAHSTIGVDTPEELTAAEAAMRKKMRRSSR